MAPPKKRAKTSSSGTAAAAIAAPFVADYQKDEQNWLVTNASSGISFTSDDPTQDPRCNGEFVYIGGQDSGKRLDPTVDGSYNIEDFCLRLVDSEEEDDDDDDDDSSNEETSLAAGTFNLLPESSIVDIFRFACHDSQSMRSIRNVCRYFHALADDTRLVAFAAALWTQKAREAGIKANEVSQNAFKAALRPNAKTIPFDVGEYKGKCIKNKASGLGVYKAKEGSSEEYSGQWMKGSEHGIGHAKYDDGTSYSGVFVKGRRHGYGVYCFTDDYNNQCRYEGMWKNDQRSGLGLLMGGAYRFLVGQYKNGNPVGIHLAFNYDMKEVDKLDMS